MMLKFCFAALLITLSGIGITSCKKDTPEPAAPKSETCQLTRIKYGSTAGTAVITRDNIYNNSRQLIRSNEYDTSTGSLESYETYTYNAAGKMEELKYYYGQSVPAFFSVVYEYDAQGRRQKHTFRDSNGNITSVATYQYNSANQLIRTDIDQPSTVHLIDSYKLYVYDPSGNTTSVSTYDTGISGTAAELDDIIEFTYDNKINPDQYSGTGNTNKNNVTSITMKDGNGAITSSVSYSFTYNSKGYPIESVNPGSNKISFWEYQCQ